MKMSIGPTSVQSGSRVFLESPSLEGRQVQRVDVSPAVLRHRLEDRGGGESEGDAGLDQDLGPGQPGDRPDDPQQLGAGIPHAERVGGVGVRQPGLAGGRVV